jgi:chromosome segregation protein
VAERDRDRDAADRDLRAASRGAQEAAEALRAAERRLQRRREAPLEDADGRRAQLDAELRAEQRMEEHARRERLAREERRRVVEARIAHEARVVAGSRRARAALEAALVAVRARQEELERRLEEGREQAEASADEVRARAGEEAELGRRAREAGGEVTRVEVRLERARDAAERARAELEALAAALGLSPPCADAALPAPRRDELRTRVERLGRRREQLGPVNPLAREEYEEARAQVAELEAQRGDLESALHELEGLIRDTDREIRAAFDATFAAAATAFEDVVAHLFPGGGGRLSLARAEEPAGFSGEPTEGLEAGDPDAELADEPGVEVEVTPAGKSMRRLSLLSGGEKSLVALAFMFAVFLARPCPFYILDEVEAALDDRNIDRFLELVRRYSDRAQFIIVTHQKRTMDAADCLYGVSMAGDGVSRVVSRRLEGATATRFESPRAA